MKAIGKREVLFYYLLGFYMLRFKTGNKKLRKLVDNLRVKVGIPFGCCSCRFSFAWWFTLVDIRPFIIIIIISAWLQFF